MLVYNKQFIG